MTRSAFREAAAGLAVSALFWASTPVEGALTAIGPLPYVSAADSPFVNDPSLVTVLEDFEDGALNVPGISNAPITTDPPYENEGRGVVMPPGTNTDSVDGDDGKVDGFGNDGHSLRSTAFSSVITLPPTHGSSLVLIFSHPWAGSIQLPSDLCGQTANRNPTYRYS